MTQRLIIFTGNIGCGKSTKAEEFASEGYVVVSMDAITAMIGGGNYVLYDEAKKDIYRETEKICIWTALLDTFSVVVDRTNMKRSDRGRYINMAKKINDRIRKGIEVVSYNWGPGDIDSLNRRLQDPRGVPAERWKKVHSHMAFSYEVPTLSEGFDSITCIGADQEEGDIS